MNIIEKTAKHIARKAVLTEADWLDLMAATDAVETTQGQWKHPGRCTVIPSGQITMRRVPYRVLAFDETGHTKIMHPEQEYAFPGHRVFEIPLNGQQQTLLMQLQNKLRSWREL
jgi:hypothetical protein